MTTLTPALATPADATSATSLDSAMNEQYWILLVRAQGGNREAFGQLSSWSSRRSNRNTHMPPGKLCHRL